jgi:hypothetical protein
MKEQGTYTLMNDNISYGSSNQLHFCQLHPFTGTLTLTTGEGLLY